MSRIKIPKVVIINVTAADIKSGDKKNAFACPIARAAKRVFDADEIMVSDTLDVDGRVYYLPSEAEVFINAFDAGEKVKPFKFKVYA